MATENILMDAVERGGDRQELHEHIRVHSIAAANAVKMEGKPCDLLSRIAADPAFQTDEETLTATLSPENFIGCAAMQTREYLSAVVDPLLAAHPGESVRAQEIKV